MPPQLQELFADGTLVRPSDQHANLIHLVRALATLAGVPDLANSPATQQFVELISPHEHLVFILMDGMGMNIVDRLPHDSFIRKHLRMQIHATSPSTTACALTTIATAQYPNRHGVAGWFTYVPELNRTIATLPFNDRFTGEPLVTTGIRPEDVLPLTPVCPRMTRHPLTIVPALIANTAYNIYSRGGTPGQGYYSFAHAMDRIIAHVTTAGASTYTHLYLPEIDTLCHKRGTEHPDIVPLVMRIDVELARLATVLAGRARIVVCADHGLVDVPAADQALLEIDDPLLELLRVPPSGDARMPVFHVKPDRHEQFIETMAARFFDRMILLSSGEIEKLELFGPEPFSPRARGRFGDFIGILTRRATLSFHPPGKPLGSLYLAVHAGLSPEEMLVPLCIA